LEWIKILKYKRMAVKGNRNLHIIYNVINVIC